MLIESRLSTNTDDKSTQTPTECSLSDISTRYWACQLETKCLSAHKYYSRQNHAYLIKESIMLL